MRPVALLALACLIACRDADGGARDGAVVMDQAIVVDAATDQAGGDDLTPADFAEDDLAAGPLDDLTNAPLEDLTGAPPEDLTPACASPCAFGCDTTSGTCRDLVPANQAAAHLGVSGTANVFTCTGTPDATLPVVTAGNGDTLTFNTAARTITRTGSAATFTARWGADYTPTGGHSKVIVAHVKSLDVTGGAKVAITGNRALILLVDGDAAVTGAVLSTTGSFCAPTAPQWGRDAQGDAGGGGSGHGTAGAPGAGPLEDAGAGGGSYGSAAILECGGIGGHGAPLASLGGSGGTGGGGLQLTACGTITIGDAALLNVSGLGGSRGEGGQLFGGGGGGGGAAGTVILEGANLVLGGAGVANGGGGGEGGAGSFVAGHDGATWDPTTTPVTRALGGTGTTNAGAGGRGGVEGVAPEAGKGGLSAGGGGGAVGRIVLNVSPLAAKPTFTATNFSPLPKTSKTCVSGQTCSYAFDP